MTADLDPQIDRRGAALDHGPGVDTVHRVFSEPTRATEGGPEQRALVHFPNARRFDIGIEIGFEIMMCRQIMAFTAFFVEPNPPAFALRAIVLDPHTDRGADPRKGKGHDADQRAIAQADQARHLARCAV